MAEQKYLTETMLGLCSKGSVLLRPSDIKNATSLVNETERELLHNCHIYIIGKRPKLSIVPDFLKVERDFIYGQLVFHIKGQKRVEHFRLPRQLFQPTSIGFRVSEYPHNRLFAFDASNNLIHDMPLSLIVQYFHFVGETYHLLDVEVVYIGQAFGKNGERNAIERLKEHSTLQKIQAEMSANDPDSEILILLFEYDQPFIGLMIDGGGNPMIKGGDDSTHYKRVISTDIAHSQIITMAEAGLIRYFQPHYNMVYKDSFPSTNLKSLRTCYELDFVALSVEVDTKNLCLNIYSPLVKTHYHHLAIYDLHSTEKRANYFNFKDVPSSLKKAREIS